MHSNAQFNLQQALARVAQDKLPATGNLSRQTGNRQEAIGNSQDHEARDFG